MRKFLPLLTLLFMIANHGAWAQTTVTIGSQSDFDTFVSNVNNGDDNYSGKTVKLAANVSLTTPIGTDANPFSGCFDGNGKTLSVDISDTKNAGTAPFRYVNGATIENLTVTGDITGGIHAAGLVGYTKDGQNNITMCVVNVNLSNPATSGDRHMGGIVGHGRSATLTLSECIFGGSMSSSGSIAGGLLGWSDGSALIISDCLFKGTYTGKGAFHPVAVKRNDKSMKSVSVTNCYYTVPSTNYNQAYIAADGTRVLTSKLSSSDQAVTAVDGNTYYINSNVSVGFSIDDDFTYGQQGFFYINMGYERTLTITDTSLKFSVYDDGGKNGDFSSDNPYVQKLHFVAPEGYVFEVDVKVVKTEKDNRLIATDGVKEIFKVTDCNSISLGNQQTTDNHLNIEFDMVEFNAPQAGFELNVRLKPNEHIHAITLPISDDYTLTAPSTAIYGHTVTLKFDFNGDYVLSTVKVAKTGDAATEVPVNRVDDFTCTFTMPDYPVTVTTGALNMRWVSGSTVCYLVPDGTFTVTGTGAMADYVYGDDKPWHSCINKIKNVVIEDGVTTIGAYAFGDATNLTNVTFGSGVTTIGNRAFSGCSSLASLTIPAHVTNWGLFPFEDCGNISDVYCYVQPEYLTVESRLVDDFKPGKATKFHVSPFFLQAYQEKFSRANVTWVGDLAPNGSWTDNGNYATSYSSQSGKTIHITNEREMARMARQSSEGETFTGYTILLDCDLNMSSHYWTPVGTDSKSFMGTFDGQGHTISGIIVSNGSNPYNGLFGFLGGLSGSMACGMVKNVNVMDGSIKGGSCTGALVGKLRYGKVLNCNSNASVAGNNYVGGLVGEAEGLINNNIYAYISNSLYVGNSVTGNSSRGAVLGHRVNSYVTLTNNYYTDLAVNGLSSNDVYALPIVDRSGLDINVTFDTYTFTYDDETYYSTDGTFTVTAKDPYNNVTSVRINGTEVATEGGTLPLSIVKDLNAKTAEITATQERLLAGNGTEEDPFQLRTLDDWNFFVKLVNTGTTFSGKVVKLMNNIEDIETMVGKSETESFQGTFDGNKLYLKASINNTDEYAALFRYVKDATIKDLKLAGSYNVGKFGAALVGRNYGNTTINNIYVHNEVSVANSQPAGSAYVGGLVGHGGNSTLTMKQILYYGKIKNEADYCGGLLGWCDGMTLNMENCTFLGSHTGNGKFHPIAVRAENATMQGAVSDTYFYTPLRNGIDNKYIAVEAIRVQHEPITDVDEGKFVKTYNANGNVCYYYDDAPEGFTINYDAERGTAAYYGTTLRAGETASLHLDGSISSFTVYDDGGRLGNYAKSKNSTFTIYAPEGKQMNIEGYLMLSATSGNRFFVFDDLSDADPEVSQLLADSDFKAELGNRSETVTTAENMMRVNLITNGGQNAQGFELTVTLQDNPNLHTITVVQPEGGCTIAADKTKCGQYGMVTVSLNEETGSAYILSVTSASGEEIAVTQVENSVYTFRMPNEDVTVTAASLALIGSGTEDAPLQIRTYDEWKILSEYVALGNNLIGKHVSLKNDIYAGHMVGTSATPFAGTFHGNGYTITAVGDDNDLELPFGGTTGCDALFSYIDGASIEDLQVAGNFEVGQHGAALVGKASGTNLIRNVVVSATVGLASDLTPNKHHHGGVIGHALSSNTTLEGVVFSGTLMSSDESISGNGSGNVAVGGLVGWSDNATLTINNCIFSGTYSGKTPFHPIAVKNTSSSVKTTANRVYYTAPSQNNILNGNVSVQGVFAQGSDQASDRLGDVVEDYGNYGFVTAFEYGLKFNGQYYYLPFVDLYDNVDNTATLEGNKNQMSNVTIHGRTLYKDNSWNTLCLPFSMSAQQVREQLNPTGLMKIDDTDLDDGILTIDFINVTNINAGTPYIIKWESGDNISDPTFTSVNITAIEGATEEEWNTNFIGTFSPVTLKANDLTRLYLGDDNKLYYPSADVTIGAFRAYFELDGLKVSPYGPQGGVSGVHQFVLNFGDDETVTGIINTLSPDEEQKEAPVYSVDGRRISGKPSTKGIYIQNGRKFVVK